MVAALSRGRFRKWLISRFESAGRSPMERKRLPRYQTSCTRDLSTSWARVPSDFEVFGQMRPAENGRKRALIAPTTLIL